MDKVVLITGASTGIGRATAELFAQKGWQVAASMRSPERAAGWVRSPRIDEGLAQTLRRFGRLDVLVNNAGYALMGPLEALQPELLHKQFETNVVGLVALTRAVLPHFRAQREGTIVNVSSIGGRMAFPLASAYHATKWAIEGLSESLQFELRPFGVRVKLVEPGGIRTDFISRGTVWAEHPAYQELISVMRETSQGLDARMPGPEGVARTILRAATDRSARLRYPVHHQPYMLLRTLLPDPLWTRVAGSVLRRAARRSPASQRVQAG